jgi:hypothetical protein
MSQSPPVRARQARREPLDALLNRLAPALRGYPVKELIDLWAQTAHDGATTEQLIDLCLSSWITRLDDRGAIAKVDEQLPDELLERQRCAHHALVLVRSRFQRSALTATSVSFEQARAR